MLPRNLTSVSLPLPVASACYPRRWLHCGFDQEGFVRVKSVSCGDGRETLPPSAVRARNAYSTEYISLMKV